MKKISPELFIYELYEPNFWQRFGLAYDDFNPFKLADIILERAEGYCEASRLYVRPRGDSGAIAVMCVDEDGEKFWFHFERRCFRRIDLEESNAVE